ncbi:ribonuclease H-like protein, partial [Wolfiporia cocos MD-104 SS10]
MNELAEYDIKLAHVPGKTQIQADPLSRRPDHDTGNNELQDQIVLKDHLFSESTTSDPYQQINFIDYLTVKEQVTTLKDLYDFTSTTEITHDSEDLAYRRGKLIIPNNQELKTQIIEAHHGSILAGHTGIKKTLTAISNSYWWPRMDQDIKHYIQHCTKCQQAKPIRQAKSAPLNPNPTPDYNWENISVDMITGIPEVKGRNAIIVIVDMKSKDYVALPTTDKLTAEGWANILFKEILTQHGLPKKIFSDRGPQFVAQFITELYKIIGIEGNPSTAYHPQTDGQTERINQELEIYLRMFVNDNKKNWYLLLNTAAFAYKTHINSTTGFTPFYMTHGHEAYTGVENPDITQGPRGLQEWITHMKMIQDQATHNINKAKEYWKKIYDSHRKPSRDYKPGDKVWIEGTNLNMGTSFKKLDPRRYGPYTVTTKIGASAYKLDLPPDMRGIHNVFNESQLHPY